MTGGISGKELPGPWAKTYAATTKQELLDAYQLWSPTYDKDSIDKFGYVAPRRAAQALARHFHPDNNNGRIADIGAGTGLVGQELSKLGFTHIAALDYSPAMLAKAQEKDNSYQEFYCVDLLDDTEKMQATTGSFDAAISVGTFTPHHVGITALDHVIDLIRPGGILTLSLRQDFVADTANGFQARLQYLQDVAKKLKLLEVTEPELYTPKVSQTIDFRCWTFQVLS